MDELRAICARMPGNDVVAAECAQLTGGSPDEEGVAACTQLEGISRSAYIRLGLRWIAQGATLEELCQYIRNAHIYCDDFRIEFLRLSNQLTISKKEAILNVADSITGYPCLDTPTTRFLIVVQKDHLWLGEIVATPQKSYRRHDLKPYHSTISLPARLSRALANLVSPPAQTILDPFCGTGSILLEANAIGLTAYGVDNNPHMVAIARRNLEFFGYPPSVEIGDALDCSLTADAIVTDLPYGRVLEPMDDQLIFKLFQHCTRLAPKAIFLVEKDVSGLMQAASYTDIRVYCVQKWHGMKRFIHVGTTRGAI